MINWVIYYVVGFFFFLILHVLYSSIKEKVTREVCPSTNHWYLNKTYCYYYNNQEKKNWNDAKDECKRLNTSLAYFRNATDFEFFKSVKDKFNEDFWASVAYLDTILYFNYKSYFRLKIGLRIKPSNEIYWEFDNSTIFNDAWLIGNLCSLL